MGHFIFGLGLGVTAGLLLAPRSGQDTRGLITSKANDGVDYVKKQTQELRDSALDMVDRGKDAVSRQVEKIASSQEHAARVYQR